MEENSAIDIRKNLCNHPDVLEELQVYTKAALFNPSYGAKEIAIQSLLGVLSRFDGLVRRGYCKGEDILLDISFGCEVRTYLVDKFTEEYADMTPTEFDINPPPRPEMH